MQTTVLNIVGMSDAEKAQAVAATLQTMAGVSAINITTARGQAEIKYDGAVVSPQILADQLSRAGFPAQAEGASSGSCCGGCCGG